MFIRARCEEQNLRTETEVGEPCDGLCLYLSVERVHSVGVLKKAGARREDGVWRMGWWDEEGKIRGTFGARPAQPYGHHVSAFWDCHYALQ